MKKELIGLKRRMTLKKGGYGGKTAEQQAYKKWRDTCGVPPFELPPLSQH
ncbi:hypothetical protein GEOBRER4_n2058 [Citrifermentans bremense]|uniref:Uncharacterized protein n=1 Tax=Citrifermentans bremense TaxID=60035 RepID=A0A7R7IYT7_9BACT|nr:hypothetical protein [Citrifermentans bremense]BCO11383.1 hypothetical protein GEOBRER4_n2058 [Citrifermentans bremense]